MLTTGGKFSTDLEPHILQVSGRRIRDSDIERGNRHEGEVQTLVSPKGGLSDAGIARRVFGSCGGDLFTHQVGRSKPVKAGRRETERNVMARLLPSTDRPLDAWMSHSKALSTAGVGD